MNVIVEVGNEEEREAIRKDVDVVSTILEELGIKEGLASIVVPQDVAATIGRLTNDPGYTSHREHHEVIAKVLHLESGATLVLSPIIFAGGMDCQVRLLTYFHETMHVMTNLRFCPIETTSPSARWYLTNLYILYDEYYANRRSLQALDGLDKTCEYEKYVIKMFLCHVRSLRSEQSYYIPMRREIQSYKRHGDLRLFLTRVGPLWDQAAKTIMYVYSFVDYKERDRSPRRFSDFPFMNHSTEELVDFLRSKYAEQDFNLHDGVEVMAHFTANFGMRWRDLYGGARYDCDVLDI